MSFSTLKTLICMQCTKFVPGLIHISLVLSFCGLGDLVYQIDEVIFINTMVHIDVCLCFYFTG